MFISDIHLVEQSIITRGCLEIYVYFRLLGQSKNEICSLGLLVFSSCVKEFHRNTLMHSYTVMTLVWFWPLGILVLVFVFVHWTLF